MIRKLIIWRTKKKREAEVGSGITRRY